VAVDEEHQVIAACTLGSQLNDTAAFLPLLFQIDAEFGACRRRSRPTPASIATPTFSEQKPGVLTAVSLTAAGLGLTFREEAGER
jgi:hypothetical protein